MVIFAVVTWIFNPMLALSACATSKEKIWIVVSLKMSDGKSAEMTFDNPSVPDITLEECKIHLPKAIPTIMNFVRKEPKLVNASLKSARCVQSIDDPIKPK
jgi:hypothetical protein